MDVERVRIHCNFLQSHGREVLSYRIVSLCLFFCLLITDYTVPDIILYILSSSFLILTILDRTESI